MTRRKARRGVWYALRGNFRRDGNGSSRDFYTVPVRFALMPQEESKLFIPRCLGRCLCQSNSLDKHSERGPSFPVSSPFIYQSMWSYPSPLSASPYFFSQVASSPFNRYSPRSNVVSAHHRVPISATSLLTSTLSPLYLTPPSLLSQVSNPLFYPTDICIQGDETGRRLRQGQLLVKPLKDREDLVRKEHLSARGIDWSGSEVFNYSNAISFGRLLSGPVLAWMIVHGFLQQAFVGLLFAAASDWLDGYIARKQGINSVLGSYLDPLADKVLIGCVALSMAYSGLLHSSLVMLILARDGLLVLGAVIGHANFMGWKCKSWRDFFNVGEGGMEKVEPLFISKVNTVLQLVLIGVALLQSSLSVLDASLLAFFLSCAVACTTCASGLGYGFKYLWKQRSIVKQV
eukprot:c23925_g1_i2 orf=286-1491(+)